MFRCQSVLWGILAWALIFSYTWLTYIEANQWYQTIPILALFSLIILLNTLLFRAAEQTKSVLIFSTWGFFALVALLLRVWNVITDWHLNLIVAIFSIIASAIWLIAGHIENVTEPGLYWHVWSILSVFSILCAYNNDSQTAIIIYAVNTALLSFTHILYIRHTLITQQSGKERCIHLFRTISCLIIILSLLIGSICYKTNDILETEWQQWVIVTEVVLLAMLIIDGILGFTNNRYKNIEYGEVFTEDVDDLI